MAVLATSGITLPKNIADGMFKKAQQGSAIAALSGAEPQQFGEVTYMTLTGRPKAELVGEGADKGDTNATFGTKLATPHKFQVTMRFNEEVQWADEAYQLSVLQTLADEGGLALSRALDLGGFHGINPRAGTVASSIAAGDRIASTTNAVEITTATLTTPDLVIEQAAGLVIADGYVPNGIAFDPTYSWTVATARYADGRKKYPELGFGANIGAAVTWWQKQQHGGMPTATADILLTGHYHHLTVMPSGRNPVTGKSKWWLQAPTTDNGSAWFRNIGHGDSDAGLLVFDIDENGFDLSSLTVL